jgi:uncharacterized protein (DUF433 family)
MRAWGDRLEETVSDEELLSRITSDPDVMVGQPCIRGTRLTVKYIVSRLGHGSTIEDILEEYQGLEREDVLACLLFAARMLEDITFVPLASAV